MNEKLAEAITKGDRNSVQSIVNESLTNGEKAESILNDSMVTAMREIGEKFSRNEIYVPEMLIAARAMQSGLDILEEALVASGHKTLGKVAIGTVKGDLHDIGKNLVAIMLKGAGYEVNDLGVNCDITKYEKAVDDGAQIVLCSALLTTTMPYMKTVVDHFKDNENVKVVIGGAPVTQDYADSISADGYGSDAYNAVVAIDQMLSA
ncbi:MAG TPA: B12-binding domain-containing protein [Victivallales bacterium]|nr:B12-binding domain-containing protein [Victivallales bacterium]